ncbi:hypothetical protein V5279_25130 [Bradyrhizobium sp. 26S5]|uniref:hypothetical protein n=1 Tax=Bradyrhizobium sp. 26S5 TaxID=3139729 RepID=UPI0030CACA44
MSLTPKDWKTFQHYKERRPPWIKLHRPLLDNIDFQRLPVASRALAPMLWLYAAEYENGVITETLDDIAYRLRMSVEDFNEALKPLLQKEFFCLEQGASDPLADCKIASALKTETEAERETDTRAKNRPASAQIDLEEAIAAKRSAEPSRFDEFWQAYPRRDGPNPRKPAETRFNSLVKTGLDPAMLIAAAAKLAADEQARGNIGTRFIPQACTWLNQQRWSDHAAVAALAEAKGTAISELQLESAVKFYARTRVWSRHAGPEPGLSGCRASPELLQKHGLAPDGRKLPDVVAA